MTKTKKLKKSVEVHVTKKGKRLRVLPAKLSTPRKAVSRRSVGKSKTKELSELIFRSQLQSLHGKLAYRTSDRFPHVGVVMHRAAEERCKQHAILKYGSEA